MDKIYQKIANTIGGEYEKNLIHEDLELIGELVNKQHSLHHKAYHNKKENITLLETFDGKYNLYQYYNGLHNPSEFLYHLSRSDLLFN